MRHIKLTNKKGKLLLVHVEDIVEVFDGVDRIHTVCVIRVEKHESDNTFVLVKESVNEIYEKLKACKYEMPG